MDFWDKLRYLAEKNEVGANNDAIRPCEECTEQECRCLKVFDTDKLESQKEAVKSSQNQLCNFCGFYKAEDNSLKCESCNGILNYQKAWLLKKGIISTTYNSDAHNFYKNHPCNKK